MQGRREWTCSYKFLLESKLFKKPLLSIQFFFSTAKPKNRWRTQNKLNMPTHSQAHIDIDSVNRVYTTWQIIKKKGTIKITQLPIVCVSAVRFCKERESERGQKEP